MKSSIELRTEELPKARLRARPKAKEVALNLSKMGLTSDMIAKAVEVSVDTVQPKKYSQYRPFGRYFSWKKDCHFRLRML